MRHLTRLVNGIIPLLAVSSLIGLIALGAFLAHKYPVFALIGLFVGVDYFIGYTYEKFIEAENKNKESK